MFYIKNHNKSVVDSEIIQRIAFSFGYTWPLLNPKDQTVQKHSFDVLYFNSKTKEITWGSLDQFEKPNDWVEVNGLGQLVEFFNNPPCNELEIEFKDDLVAKVCKSGNVIFKMDGFIKSFVIFSHEFDRLVKERNEFLSKFDKQKK